MSTTASRRIVLRLKDALQTIEDLLHDGEEFEIHAPIKNERGQKVADMVLTKHQVSYLELLVPNGETGRGATKKRGSHVAVRHWINYRLREVEPDSVITIEHIDPPEE